MTKQTQDYIVLKPLTEKFKNVAATISENEIRSIILDEFAKEIREQIHDKVEFGSIIGEWVDTMMEDDEWVELVERCMKESIKSKFR